MEFHPASFGVTRPPSESLPERGKWLKSELEPNLEPQQKSEEPLELEPQPKLEPKPKPKCGPPKWYKPPKSDPPPRWYYSLNSKQVKKLKMSDFSMYDDDPEPFMFMCQRFVYKNKAQIIKDEQIKVAMDDYRERSRNLSVFDAISRPKISNHLGGRPVPIDLTEDRRLRLTPLCKLALDKYNAEKDSNFAFAEIVKTTWSAGAKYYITFLARDSSTSLTTFQTHVVDQRPAPEVMSCAIKP